jgi:hypothetical protein
VRVGGSFSYSVPTTPGHTYLLRFTFVEVWWTTAARRLFDVRVNGVAVLTAVDPFGLAMAQFTPAMQEVTMTAAAGSGMTVSFAATRDNAILAAMEVRASCCVCELPCSPDVCSFVHCTSAVMCANHMLLASCALSKEWHEYESA